MHTSPKSAPAVESVRSFNRFYTRHLGLLQDGLLGSGMSLTESRVLYELTRNTESTASDIGSRLQLDAGYMSRLLRKFEQLGIVTRQRSSSDKRERTLRLSKQGAAVFGPLDRAARDQIALMLEPLSTQERDELVAAMQRLRILLKDDEAVAQPCTLRDLQVGDIGWIVRRQALLYSTEYGWNGAYEALLADILAKFVANFDAAFEQAWIAERSGEIIGSVFLVRADEAVAKLRALYVEPSARGSGLGRRLVQECIESARRRGYRSMTLWTNDCLSAARRIYQAAGFELAHEQPHHSFGKDLIGQTWNLSLR